MDDIYRAIWVAFCMNGYEGGFDEYSLSNIYRSTNGVSYFLRIVFSHPSQHTLTIGYMRACYNFKVPGLSRSELFLRDSLNRLVSYLSLMEWIMQSNSYMLFFQTRFYISCHSFSPFFTLIIPVITCINCSPQVLIKSTIMHICSLATSILVDI